MNESRTGLGRLGDSMWGFQSHDILPDVLSIGGGLGNGFPLAAVITSRHIASSVQEYLSTVCSHISFILGFF